MKKDRIILAVVLGVVLTIISLVVVAIVQDCQEYSEMIAKGYYQTNVGAWVKIK